jgi:hypothetical protein
MSDYLELKDQINSRYGNSDTYLSTKREMWDEYEYMFHNTLDDNISDKTKSQTFDPKLATYTLEREYRVMAQLPSGKVRGISKNDKGSSKLMNLILDKYILPNANAGWDFLTKCRMVDRYSNIYGNFFVMVDWDVKSNGYKGPDMWLIPIRDVFPQVGAVSLDDSEYIIIQSWRNLSFFQDLSKREGFKNVNKIVDKLKKVAGDKEEKDTTEMSIREQDHFENTSSLKGKGFYKVLSMYERDRWVDYVPAADEIMRDSKNPHDNGELPVVNKFSIPLVDDVIGMGDFERGASMQKTLNSTWNLYLDAVKMSIFPPVLVNKDNIASMSSIQFGPAAKWLVRGNVGNVAQTLNLTPQGINTFNNTNQNVNASIQNLFGTSDTSITSSTEPGYGKTPEALKMQAARQNSRDVTDRFYMEQFLTKVINKFVNLMSKSKSKSVAIRMFEDEIKELTKQYPEMEEMYDENDGKLTINKGKMGSMLYDYEIISGSTYRIDEESQNQNLIQLFQILTKDMQMGQQGITSPIIEALKAEGKKTNLGELITRLFANSGLQDFDKIITEEGEEEKNDNILNEHKAQLQNTINQILGTGTPEQMMNPNEIPAQPNMQQMTPQAPGQGGVNFG